MTDNTDFRFDGGATWLNLLATRGQSFGSRPIERIATPEAARQWLTQVGYPPSHALTATDRDELARLRETLRGLAMAVVAGAEAPTGGLSHVQSVAAAITHRAFTVAPERGVPVKESLGLIAIQALVTLSGPDRKLLKECAEADCRWVFLDTSGRRHWCPSPACASRGRVRAYRARIELRNP